MRRRLAGLRETHGHAIHLDMAQVVDPLDQITAETAHVPREIEAGRSDVAAKRLLVRFLHDFRSRRCSITADSSCKTSPGMRLADGASRRGTHEVTQNIPRAADRGNRSSVPRKAAERVVQRVGRRRTSLQLA